MRPTQLTVIKANSVNIRINDDGVVNNRWKLSPKEKPDTYTAFRTRQTKWVTFYTDIDSIRIKVKPGSSFDFVIIYKGADSCFTRVKSAIPPVSDLMSFASPDTIPFRLTAFNAIAVKALINGKDTVNMHFDASSAGIHLLKEVIMQRFKEQKFRTLQIGRNILKNPEILSTNATAQDMDGRIGFTVFEGKQVELNYDKNF